MKKPHYGWLVSVGGMLATFSTSGITVASISVLMPYIIESGAMRSTGVSAISSIRSLFVILGLPAVPRLLERLGVLLSGISMILFGYAGSAPAYYTASALAGLAFSLGGMPSISILIEQWFADRKMAVVGLCAAGSGVAGIIIPPVFTYLAETIGLRPAFLLEAAFCFGVTAYIYFIIRERPQELGLEPYRTSGRPGSRTAKTPSAFHAGIPRRAKIYAFFSSLLIGACACCSYQHLVVLYQTAGFPAMAASLLFTLASIMQVIGKVLLGNLADRLGAYRVNYLFFGCMSAGLALCSCAGTGGFPLAVAVVLVLGTGLPLCSVGLSVYAHDLAASGREYSMLVSLFNLAYLLGNLLYAPCAGAIAGRTGSYTGAYLILCILSLAALTLIQLVYRRLRGTAQPGA